MGRPIKFYLPASDWPPFHGLPGPEEMKEHPRRFLSPALNWVWRTYLHLAETGVPCELVSTLPDEGLVVTAACNLPLLHRPGRRFIVSCVADSPPRFFAPCQLFQSATQAEAQSTFLSFPINVHIPHWPQPALQPRDPARGRIFQHVDYFGARDQLAAELQSPAVAVRLGELGLKLRCHFEHYHDYRETDAVVAVRRFGGDIVRHKPASKLINAWLAGVPALLGPEHAFRELRESDFDYLEVGSVASFLEACARLKSDLALRDAMAAQARRRGAEFSTAALTQRWRELLTATLSAAQEQWEGWSEARRQAFYAERAARRYAASVVRRCSLATRKMNRMLKP